MEVTAQTPSEVLNMDPLERDLAVKAAVGLEEWRLKQQAKMHGAK